MKHYETTWKSKDGLDIFAQAWGPDVVQPRAVICLVHGLGEHSGRYAHVAEALSKEGFILLAADLRGHGKSAGAKGHIHSIEDILLDIDTLFEQAHARYTGLPTFLYGHSLGAILVLYYSLKRKMDVKGVIATSAGLHNDLEKQSLKILLAKILGSLMPNTSLASGLDVNGISRDKSVIDAYKADPLVHGQMTLGFGKVMLEVIKWTLDHAKEFSYPLLLLHGKKDPIAYVSSSIEFAEALKDKATLVLWDEGLHELHNEPEKDEVFKTMSLWMDARLKE